MGLTTEQIITILELPGIGRKTAFKICEAGHSERLGNFHELFDWLGFLSNKREFLKISKITEGDFQKAVFLTQKIQEDSCVNNINIISYYDESFPKLLKLIDDAPLILNYKGNLNGISNRIGVAIIGTREPNTDGLKAGELVGKFFAEQGGFNVVSGLAVGCDSSAHKGCLMGNGFTTAILAHGLQTVYPKENLKLSEEILDKGGVLLSEYLYGKAALPNYFIERDRLQSGLSIGTIVIQTDINGGTMHAVRATLKNKKFLGAIEYKDVITNAYSKTTGNHLLIKSGEAMAVTSSNLNSISKIIVSNYTNIESTQHSPKLQKPIQTSCF